MGSVASRAKVEQRYQSNARFQNFASLWRYELAMMRSLKISAAQLRPSGNHRIQSGLIFSERDSDAEGEHGPQAQIVSSTGTSVHPYFEIE